MARLRFMAVALVALAFACSSIQLGRTQQGYTSTLQPATPKPAEDGTCVIYSLTEMGLDVAIGSWIADVVPEMIEPSSWKNQSGTGAIRYYPHKNILIVKQSSTIQKKVEGFLKELKTTMPKPSAAHSAGKKAPPAGVVSADYREPAVLRASNQVSESSSYPVPAAVKPPKHLFHFIIRYEGDGIIDDNVVKFMKSQLQGAKSPVSVSLPTVTTVPCAPPVPAPGVAVTPPGPSSYPVPASPPYNSPPPSPVQAGATLVPAASAAPAQELGSPPPSETPKPSSPAPKKKKEKKDAQKVEHVPN